MQFPSEQLLTVTSPCQRFIGGCRRSKSCVSPSFNLQKLICYTQQIQLILITWRESSSNSTWGVLSKRFDFGKDSFFFGLQYMNPPSWCLLLVVTELIDVPTSAYNSFSRIVLFLLAIFDNVPIFFRCWDSHPSSSGSCSVDLLDYTNLSCFHQLLGGFSSHFCFSFASFKPYSSSWCLTAQFSLIWRISNTLGQPNPVKF